MQLTTNYSFKKPESTDPYNINDFNETFDIIDRELKAASEKADTVTEHPSDMNNPHQTTAAQVGLGNVPNVATNDQTPTYTVATANTALSSGEKLSIAFGKIAKAISSLISHLADTVGHITAAERTAWNAKLDKTAMAADSDKLDGYHASDFLRVAGGGYVSAPVQVVSLTTQNVEISGTTPFIDFHYGDSSADYTSRIIEAENGTLNVIGNLKVNSNQVLHKGNSVSVIVSATAPADTTAVWIVPS